MGALNAVFVLYIMWLEHRKDLSPREVLCMNARMGGDNCHRGALLGALIGMTMGGMTSKFENL